ncbi:hypothetical protein Plhal703r1_c06g0034181 [Plasmopara halstedii]
MCSYINDMIIAADARRLEKSRQSSRFCSRWKSWTSTNLISRWRMFKPDDQDVDDQIDALNLRCPVKQTCRMQR